VHSNLRRNMVSAGEFIVGTLVVAGAVKPEDAERAIKIVEEELGVWLAIKKHNEAN
jgi:TATA-box binding protein (TBP) (component of TFIID and TFIIIB)